MHVDIHQAVRQIIEKSLLGELPPHEQQTLREHLNTCAGCKEYLEISDRVVAGLRGFSFEVNPELQGKVMASLTQRAQQLELSGAHMPMRWVYLAALVLTIAGSYVAQRLTGFTVGALHMHPAPLESGVVALWIVPSLCFCLLFPVLHRLAAGEKGTSQ
jgi:predicted anti-sigma-YlaC factor YlaD